jgi:HPt (histidine-containing phosphotransfer) domain-containing protein
MAQSSAAAIATVHPAKRAMRPIDLVHLAKQCLGDEGLEAEILRMFDATIESYGNRLRAATDTSEVSMILHSIKGAASGVGAWTLADLAKTAEGELHGAKLLPPETVGDLSHAIEEVRTFISRLLSSDLA